MKKKIITTFGAFLMVICGVFTAFQLTGCSGSESGIEKDETDTVVSLVAADIDEFSYWHNKQKIQFIKEDNMWYKAKKVTADDGIDGVVLNTIDGSDSYVADKKVALSQDAISSMLATVENIKATEKITDTSLRSEYGFEDPVNRIALKLGDEQINLTIGKYDEEADKCYMMLEDDFNIYVVDGSIYSAFQKSITELTENN